MPEPPSTERLARFIFALPEPLPFPDGTVHQAKIGNAADAVTSDDDPWVTLAIHQVTNATGRTSGSMAAVLEVIDRLPDLPEGDRVREDSTKVPKVDVSYTVIDAVTSFDSPDELPDGDGARDWPPRSDAFNRCLRFVNDLARAYRVTTQTSYGLPTYERIPHPILGFTADAERVEFDEGGLVGVLVGLPEGAWRGPNLMLLEHYNTPDDHLGPMIDDSRVGEFNFWMTQVRYGNPLMQAHEAQLDARRALQVVGDYSAAVVLAQTASEILLDGVMALILWEMGSTPEDAALRFEEGKITRRVKTDFPSLLGGNWKLDGSAPAARWFHRSVRVRHRIVHGGYRPARLEAVDALNALRDLQTHTFDRLAARRDKYPRATLMTVAQSGLVARGLWHGKIKQFVEQVAPTEPYWTHSYAEWRDAMVKAILNPS
jgi:hypothetical protein